MALIEAVRARSIPIQQHEPMVAAPEPVIAGEGATVELPKAASGRRFHARHIVVGIGMVALVAATWWYATEGESATSRPGSGALAVLPLANATGDTTFDYLAQGIGEAVRSLLVKETSLRPAPRDVVAYLLTKTGSAAAVGISLEA
ncbi:MAG: hypothetical protein ABI647_20110 [Gemmatimonadota bacterium]